MLRVRPFHASEVLPWQEVSVDCVLGGFNEDTDYLLDVGPAGAEVFVDDVPLEREGHSTFRWRPNFYAGRVIAEVVRGDKTGERYHLDVSPSPAKSGLDEFTTMVAEIRAFDQSLLVGLSSATMTFGHAWSAGRYELDVLLTRLREHGPAFLSAVEFIVRSPHRFLAAQTQILPLSRVRRLHHTALHDRRIAAIATGQYLPSDSIDSFQINGLTSATTFDTPSNRTLMALLRRFRATVVSLTEAVHRCRLGGPKEEQLLRSSRRLYDLNLLARRTDKLLVGTLFREVSAAETSAAGLTQIAAQPNYSRAYRLGCRALAIQIEGNDDSEQLHVPPSWGIYELWCFLCAVNCALQVTASPPVKRPSNAAATELAVRFELPDHQRLEVLFQATFPALKPNASRLAWSLSAERRPDIVLLHHRSSDVKAMVLDAKWRSGRVNVLDAMASAHIYHDALRIGSAQPSPCILLLPGLPNVDELENDKFIHAHGVGAVSSVRPAAEGLPRLQAFIKAWLES